MSVSDIKLFRVTRKEAVEIVGRSVAVEKSLQTLLEKNLELFLGIRFLASEFATGKTHEGRIDSLGIDENGCPIIIEYKRATNENVVSQGLYYLDWLMDHKAEFQLLTHKVLGHRAADAIDWSAPRLLCIAGGFTKFDEHAVKQIDRNIELIRYLRFDDELLLLELVNATTAAPKGGGHSAKTAYKSVTQFLKEADQDLKGLFDSLRATLMALGDDVQLKTLKFYFAFKRIKNFACVEVHPNPPRLLVYIKVNPLTVLLENGFTRDVRKIGHFGTGDLEIRIANAGDIEKAKPLFEQSYNAS